MSFLYLLQYTLDLICDQVVHGNGQEDKKMGH